MSPIASSPIDSSPIASSPIPFRAALSLILALAGLLAACSSSPSSSPTGAGPGDAAPEISGTTLDGTPFHLSDLRGRPVIVNFWASWCVPCRNEFPLFKSELAKRQPDGLVIVGVLFKDDKTPALQFEQQFGATWSSVLDPDGSLARAYRVVAPPQTYFIDKAGVIRSRQIGEILESDFDRQVAAILG